MSNWLDNSEIVAGAIIAHNYNPVPEEPTLRIPISQIRPEMFSPPYDAMIKEIQKGAVVEDVVTKYFSSYQASLTAVRSLNGTSRGVDWISLLEKSAAKYRGGEELDRISKKLMRGDDVDLTKLPEIAAKIQNSEAVELYTPLSQISREKPAFVETGFVPIDTHLGGIPATGMTIVLGTPGIGKTTFAGGLVSCFAKQHPDKIVAFHTMEMLGEEISKRFDEIDKLPKSVQDRILIRDITESADDILAKASTIENLGLIVVDFAEYLVEGEITESGMSYVFRALATGSKNMRVPIVVLAQVNRKYTGGIPMPNQVYFSDAAHKFAWMFLSLYGLHSTNLYSDDPHRDIMMLRQGEAAIVCWKSRGGFRVHPKESPGGIVVQWEGKRGWRPDQSGKWRWIKQ